MPDTPHMCYGILVAVTSDVLPLLPPQVFLPSSVPHGCLVPGGAGLSRAHDELEGGGDRAIEVDLPPTPERRGAGDPGL